MPITSKVEQVRDEIVTEFEGITTDNGYRNNPSVRKMMRPLDRVSSEPELGVEIGEMRLEPADSAWTVWNIMADVWVSGTVSADTDTGDDPDNILEATESLRHDVARKVMEMSNKYATHSGSRWRVDTKTAPTMSGLQLLGSNRNKGQFYCRFRVAIPSLLNNFMSEVSGGTDGPSATVIIDGTV